MLTIQAAVVVLPVSTDGIVFLDKHDFSNSLLHKSCSLQGATNTEQFLWCTIKHKPKNNNGSEMCTIKEQQHLHLDRIWCVMKRDKSVRASTHYNVLLCDSGVEIVHCDLGSFQRTEHRLWGKMAKVSKP